MSDSRDHKVRKNTSNSLADAFIVMDDGPRTGGLVSAWTYATGDGTNGGTPGGDWGTVELDAVATTYRDAGDDADATSFGVMRNPGATTTPLSVLRVHGGTLTKHTVVFSANPGANIDIVLTPVYASSNARTVVCTRGADLATTLENIVTAVQADVDKLNRWIYIEKTNDTTLHIETKREMFNDHAIKFVQTGTTTLETTATVTTVGGAFGNASVQTNIIDDLGRHYGAGAGYGAKRQDLAINGVLFRSSDSAAWKTGPSESPPVETSEVIAPGVPRMAKFEIDYLEIKKWGKRSYANIPLDFMQPLLSGRTGLDSDIRILATHILVDPYVNIETASIGAETDLRFTTNTYSGTADITLISTDGTSKTYTANSSGTTGAVVGGKVEFVPGAGVDTAALALRDAINHANGHNAGTTNSKIVVNVVGGVVALRQATGGVAGNTTVTATADFDNMAVVKGNFAYGQDVSNNQVLVAAVGDFNWSDPQYISGLVSSATRHIGTGKRGGRRWTKSIDLTLNHAAASAGTIASEWFYMPEDSECISVSIWNKMGAEAVDIGGNVHFQIEKCDLTEWQNTDGTIGNLVDVFAAGARPEWTISVDGVHPYDLNTTALFDYGNSPGFPKSTRYRLVAEHDDKIQKNGGGDWNIGADLEFVSSSRWGSNIQVPPPVCWRPGGQMSLSLEVVDGDSVYHTTSTTRTLDDLTSGKIAVYVHYFHTNRPYQLGVDELPPIYMDLEIDAAAMTAGDILTFNAIDSNGTSQLRVTSVAGTDWDIATGDDADAETARNIALFVNDFTSRSGPSLYFSAHPSQTTSNKLVIKLLRWNLISGEAEDFLNSDVRYNDASGNAASGITLPGGGTAATFISQGHY